MHKKPSLSISIIFIIFLFFFILLHFNTLLPLFFINDDLTILYGANRALDASTSWTGYLKNILTSTSTLDLSYRPISVMLYPAFMFKVFSIDPAGYHIVNLSIHFLNAILFLLLIRLVFKDTLVACISALIYGVRDYHFINLAYAVAGCADLLVQTAMISTVFFYLKYLREGRPSYLIPVYLFFILSFLCKEIAVTLLGLLLLIYCYHHLSVGKGRVEPGKMRHLIAPLVITSFFIVSRIVMQESGAHFPSRLQLDMMIPFRFFNYLAYAVFGYHGNIPNIHLFPYSNYLEFYVGIILFILCLAALRNVEVRDKMILALLWFIIAISPMLLQPYRRAVHYSIIPSYLLIGAIVSACVSIYKAAKLYKPVIGSVLILYLFVNWQIIQLKYNDRTWTGGYIRTADSSRLKTMLEEVQLIAPTIDKTANIYIANYSDTYILANTGGDYRLHFVGEHLLQLYYQNPDMRVTYLFPGRPAEGIPVSWSTDFDEFFSSIDERRDILLLYLNGHFQDFSGRKDSARMIMLGG